MAKHQPLIGKTIGITGATAGIGLAAARVLAAKGATILGMGRSAERAAQAAADIRSTAPNAEVHFFTADLSALRQVRRLAEEIGEYVTTRHDGKMDVLVNNAGTITSRYTDTEDGYETVFTVNHLAPFLLTRELLPLLQAAPAARILTVSSRSHRNMRILWGNVMLRRFYNPLLAYKQSKLANVLFTTEFNRRLAGTTRIRPMRLTQAWSTQKSGRRIIMASSAGRGNGAANREQIRACLPGPLPWSPAGPNWILLMAFTGGIASP